MSRVVTKRAKAFKKKYTTKIQRLKDKYNFEMRDGSMIGFTPKSDPKTEIMILDTSKPGVPAQEQEVSDWLTRREPVPTLKDVDGKPGPMILMRHTRELQYTRFM